MKDSALLPLFVAAMIPFLILTVIVVATAFQFVAWQPPVQWSHLLGTGSTTVIASDSSGVYAQGYNLGQSLGGSGSLFLNKYDPSGGTIWNHTISETGYRYLNAMSVGPEGIYLSGANLTDETLLKYDLAGNNFGRETPQPVETIAFWDYPPPPMPFTWRRARSSEIMIPRET
jgi:hypothetical protein